MLDRGAHRLLLGVMTAGLMASLAPSDATAAILPCSVTWGVYVSGIPWDRSMTNIRNLDSQLNRHAEIVHWYAQWGDTGAGSFRANQAKLLNAVHSYTSVGVTGSLPLINWEPWGPHYTAKVADFPLTAIAAGQYDAYIDSWATGLGSVGYPVLLNFGHEMNGNWYPWGYGVNGNTAAQYVAAFRHVHDRFVLAGAANVKFVWNPDQWSPSGISAAAFYPGDADVDWMALDVYNWNSSWRTPYADMKGAYGQIAPLNAKPIMLAEVGSQASPPPGASPPSQAAWITTLAQTLPRSFPRVRAVVWFNQLNTAFNLASSPDQLAAARSAFGDCIAQSAPITPARPASTSTSTPAGTPNATLAPALYPPASPVPSSTAARPSSSSVFAGGFGASVLVLFTLGGGALIGMRFLRRRLR